MKVIILKDCACERDLHEITKYPREGLTVQKFKKGDELEFQEKMSNFYGSYYRVKTPKGFADISTKNSELS